jgi:5-methyltetrahydrofolate--homocysteine methyltransferase
MNLSDLLRSSGPVILDGSMGTELARRGCPGEMLASLSRPDVVLQVHRDYVAAGSHAIATNTLTMNRIFLETHRLEADVEKVNRAGAELAIAAAEGRACVLGDVSSTGQMLEPFGPYLEEEFIEAFKEQAAILAAAGVQGFIIETMIDLREALCAVKACKEAASLPVIACVSYFTKSDGGRTAMGNSVEECSRALAAAGADALGANCGSVDPDGLAEIVATIARCVTVPVVAQPNAGKPRLADGATVFDLDPAAFTAGVLKCRAAGARVLGGCCGTTPLHIKSLVEALRAAG